MELSSSSSAYDGLLLGIGLPNHSPSDPILGYFHPAATGHLTNIVVPTNLKASYLTFAYSVQY